MFKMIINELQKNEKAMYWTFFSFSQIKFLKPTRMISVPVSLTSLGQFGIHSLTFAHCHFGTVPPWPNGFKAHNKNNQDS